MDHTGNGSFGSAMHVPLRGEEETIGAHRRECFASFRDLTAAYLGQEKPSIEM